jgi:DNA-binding response OmpR family regulator
MRSPTDAKILIADDDPEILTLVARLLGKRGYDVLEASDGLAALELARTAQPDLVVLDVMMPGMNGWEVAKALRHDDTTKHIGILILTAIGETINEMTSPLYGADAHLDKPFEFSELDKRIAETLERRRAGALGRPDGALGEDGTVSFSKPIVRAKPSLAKAASPKAKAKPPKAKAKPPKAKAKPVPKAKAKPVPKAKVKPPKAKAKAKPSPKAKATTKKTPAKKAGKKAKPAAKKKR